MDPFTDSYDHLAAELARLDVLLQRELRLVRLMAPPATEDELRGLVITEDEIDRVADQRSVLLERDRQQIANQDVLEPFDERARRLRVDIERRLSDTARAGRTPALRALADRLQLTAFEADLLLIALAPEIESRYETLYAYLQNDITRKRPSVDLALNVLTRSSREKLCRRALVEARAPLIRGQLMMLADEAHDRDPSTLRRYLKVEAAVVEHVLRAVDGSEARRALRADADLTRDLAPDTQATLDRLAHGLARTAESSAVVLEGDSPEALRGAAQWLADSLGRRAHVVRGGARDAGTLPTAIRDALVSGSILVLDALDAATAQDDARPERVAAPGHAFEAYKDLLIVLTRPGTPFRDLPPAETLWRVVIPPPAYARRLAIWEEEAGQLTTPTERARLADSFRFERSSVRQAVSLARGLTALQEPGARSSATVLFEAGRLMTTPALQRFAVRRVPRHGWTDLVLPAERLDQLERLVSWMRYRHHVYETWGFGPKIAGGRGLSVLFSGPSGTGKTLAAEVLSGELGLDLYQIDLSSVVSKYIGETEKHLNAIFDEAERSQAILFFDEADALFGKRTEVKDAHDRYANIEVNFLLQRVERYDGLVVLASNLQRNLDEAFLRRLHDVVDFPFPDVADRERLWRGHLPKAASVAPEVDFGFLARQFKLTGGSIRNVVLDAAFRAASASTSIGMAQLIHATRTELQKQGRVPTRAEFGPYYDSLQRVDAVAPAIGR